MKNQLSSRNARIPRYLQSSRSGIGKIGGIGVVVVVILAVIIGLTINGLETSPPSPTTLTTVTPSQTQTGSSSSTSTTASLKTSQNGPLSIEVTRTTIDKTPADAQAGSTVYIYDVSITDSDTVSHLASAAAFELVSDTNTAYESSVDQASVQPLSVTTLSPGQQVAGEISFQLPAGEQPAQLDYAVPSESLNLSVANLPQPTRWVLQIGSARASIIDVGTTQGGENANASYSATATIQGGTNGLYYSTGSIPVMIVIAPFGGDAPRITITSISVSDQGFGIASVSPNLPVELTGINANPVQLIVNISTPNSSIGVGTLDLSLTAEVVCCAED